MIEERILKFIRNYNPAPEQSAEEYLARLEELDVNEDERNPSDAARITGSDIAKLSTIMPNLKKIIAYRCYSLFPIPYNEANLTNLEVLDVRWTSVKGTDFAQLISVTVTPNLKQVYVYGNWDLHSIPDNLVGPINLEKLYASNTGLTGADFDKLFAIAQKLKVIDMSSCRYEDIPRIPTDLISLEWFSVWNMDVTGTGLAALISKAKINVEFQVSVKGDKLMQTTGLLCEKVILAAKLNNCFNSLINDKQHKDDYNLLITANALRKKDLYIPLDLFAAHFIPVTFSKNQHHVIIEAWKELNNKLPKTKSVIYFLTLFGSLNKNNALKNALDSKSWSLKEDETFDIFLKSYSLFIRTNKVKGHSNRDMLMLNAYKKASNLPLTGIANESENASVFINRVFTGILQQDIVPQRKCVLS